MWLLSRAIFCFWSIKVSALLVSFIYVVKYSMIWAIKYYMVRSHKIKLAAKISILRYQLYTWNNNNALRKNELQNTSDSNKCCHQFKAVDASIFSMPRKVHQHFIAIVGGWLIWSLADSNVINSLPCEAGNKCVWYFLLPFLTRFTPLMSVSSNLESYRCFLCVHVCN